jgi:hypothetical protein
MRRRRVGLRVVGVLACAGLVTFAAYYERPAASSRTEENPVCTRSNNGSSCQRRVYKGRVLYGGGVLLADGVGVRSLEERNMPAWPLWSVALLCR